LVPRFEIRFFPRCLFRACYIFAFALFSFLHHDCTLYNPHCTAWFHLFMLIMFFSFIHMHFMFALLSLLSPLF
jgi:hypothetical protein